VPIIAAMSRNACALSVLLVLPLFAGCMVLAPVRPAAPLPHAGDAYVGGLTGVGVGYGAQGDFLDTYAYGYGGTNAAWRFADLGNFSLEADGGAGGAIGGRAPGYVATQIGLRAWWHEPALSLGIDTSALAALGLVDPSQSRLGYSHSVFQPDLRALVAVPIVDGVWLGARPGVLVIVQEHLSDSAISAAGDVPVSLTWQDENFRMAVELGVASPPFGSGIALHAGAAFGAVF
jgi:hypothetical protein